jgi:folate-dependent phosphoribosylglycinamide formyltransferase PurN
VVRVVILTGSELRHGVFRTAMAAAKGIEVVRAYCEGMENTIRSITDAKALADEDAVLESSHLAARQIAEHDFFDLYLALTPDMSNPMPIPRGTVTAHADEIRALGPDLLVAYGCSLVREPLLGWYAGRFLNVHLGLSPWYRGSGTNFWPLVNGEPEYVGATFMHIDAGVDTGEILHQIRARIFPGDGPHQIGNRLIVDMTRTYIELVRNFGRMLPQRQPVAGGNERIYRRRDFSADSIRRLQNQFAGGLVDRYLLDCEASCTKVPLVRQPALERPA